MNYRDALALVINVFQETLGIEVSAENSTD